jgi:hypothetical protein
MISNLESTSLLSTSIANSGTSIRLINYTINRVKKA